MAQLVSNHTPTSNTTGWSETGDGSIEATADGLRWHSTGTGSGRKLRYTITTIRPVSATGYPTKVYTISGIQVRRNTAASTALTQVSIYNSNGENYQGENGYSAKQNLSTSPLTVGQFVALPNATNGIGYQPSSGSTNTVYLQFEVPDGKPFDITVKSAKVYDSSDNPTDNTALDSNDALVRVTQADDSLTATFTHGGGNDEAVSRIFWDFGDGSAVVDAGASDNTPHAYPTAGVYTVKATMYPPFRNEWYASFGTGTQKYVDNANAPVTSTHVVTVPVGDFTAKFTYQVDFPVLTVNGESSTAPIRGPVQTYAWNWGDGKVDSGAKQTHEYAAPGTYNVTLTTANATTRAQSTVTKTIVIGQAAAQIGAPVWEMALYFDDPASSVRSAGLQAEMVKIIQASEIQHNWTRNEKSALRFQVPSDWLKVLGIADVDQLVSDIVLRFNFGTGWVEPPMCRFTVDTATDDPLTPETTVQVVCYLAASADFDGVFFTPDMINRPYSQAEIQAGWSRVFTASNPGTIGRALIPVATTPGSGGTLLPFTQVDFTGVVDSKNTPWVTTLSNLSVPAEANASGLQDTLVANGAIDWYAQGNVIRWFNPGTCGKRAVGDSTPTLIPGLDIASAPQTRRLTAQVWGAVVASGSKAPFVVTDPDATSESTPRSNYRGRRYVAIQSQDADSDAAALAIAKPTLRQLARARTGEMARDLIFYPGMAYAPYRDYWVGDTINAPGPGGTMIATTVEGITTVLSANAGLKVSLTLGKAFDVDPLASKVASLSGGTGLSVGAVGERPPSSTSGFIGTLASAKVTNDTGTVQASTTGLVLEGKTAGGTASLELQSDGTSAYVNSLTVYNRTYSSAANMYVTSNGRIGRSTSASRYKVNIAEQDYGTAILDLPVKTWYDLASCEGFMHRDDADVSRQIGLIAEDLDDAGLIDFVQLNHLTGEVEGIQYDRVALLLIPIVRDLRDQLAARDLVLEELLEDVANLKAASMSNSTSSP